jgi:hypothetical protein
VVRIVQRNTSLSDVFLRQNIATEKIHGLKNDFLLPLQNSHKYYTSKKAVLPDQCFEQKETYDKTKCSNHHGEESRKKRFTNPISMHTCQ